MLDIWLSSKYLQVHVCLCTYTVYFILLSYQILLDAFLSFLPFYVALCGSISALRYTKASISLSLYNLR